MIRYLALVAVFASATAQAKDGEKPYGLEQRIRWDNTRLIGTPDPPAPYRTVRVFENLKFQKLLYLKQVPGTSHVFIIEHQSGWSGPGQIASFDCQAAEPVLQTVLDLSDHTLYAVEFHPRYEENRLVYVGCNGPNDTKNKKTRVFCFKVQSEAPFALDPASQKLIIEWESDGHNGGDLVFGHDGMLYVTFGDGTSDSDTNLRGQDLSNILGTVVRIDVEQPDPDKAYSVPSDNPFVGRDGICPEIWAYGLRNPWKITVDRVRGDIWVGNNGQDLWETAYRIEKGANYGWSVYEGSHPFHPHRKMGPTPLSLPTVEHHHSIARSLTGGVVYHGKELPELAGAYIYGDYSTGKIWGCKHDGTKLTWHQELVDTALQITGFAELYDQLFVLDHNGGIYRIERNPQKEQPNDFPQRLSETGLFESVPDHRMAPSVIPYSVNAPLWSDGALKDRFLAIPGEEKIQFKPDRGWELPDKSVLIKTFYLPVKAGDTTSMRRIETRLLVRWQGEWAGYSYIWNDEQTDAVLVDAAGLEKAFTVHGEDGSEQSQSWHYPSRAECMVCHSRAANFVLGLSTAQMNRDHDYGSVTDNQLRTLEHIGMFTGKLPKRPDQYPALADPYDDEQPLEARARSYLHANCSICHVTAGGGNAKIELEFKTPADKTFLFDEPPVHDHFGIADARLISPGQPDRSVLLHRLKIRGRGQMPPLASSKVDTQAVEMLTRWIKQLTP